MAMRMWPASMTVSGGGLVVNPPWGSRNASTSAPVRSRTWASRRVWPAIGDARRVDIDHDQFLLGRQVVGDGPSDAAPAAHDDVAFHAGDLLLHATPPEQIAQLPLDDRLQHHAEGVEHRPDTGQDQEDAED